MKNISDSSHYAVLFHNKMSHYAYYATLMQFTEK